MDNFSGRISSGSVRLEQTFGDSSKARGEIDAVEGVALVTRKVGAREGVGRQLATSVLSSKPRTFQIYLVLKNQRDDCCCYNNNNNNNETISRDIEYNSGPNYLGAGIISSFTKRNPWNWSLGGNDMSFFFQRGKMRTRSTRATCLLLENSIARY